MAFPTTGNTKIPPWGATSVQPKAMESAPATAEPSLPVTTPEFGETYKLEEQIEMVNKLERKVTKTLRLDILERLEKLKEEMKDMDTYVRQDLHDVNLRDEDIFRINEKIKELEKQILNVIEG